MLQTRKSRVIFVTPTSSYEISLSKDQLLGGIEIEEHIVAEVVSVWNQITACIQFQFKKSDI